ncbi:KEOPS complex subunit Pcc1 [Salarchaeum sp. JOR-1]|uniref:KEOPS complex subunit Pcc1 n=1 Tax=Salarchaeum sp. JOR-1 TaxID=2599399 RepID=UPI001198B51E|nr:KEOPS complex subunit Pcc1 [Salarchaeum sp. JOR-1]QDX39818.1 rpo operon protein [Salarchaeum sp. JOR-1]
MTSSRHATTLRFSYASPAVAERIAASVRPESGAIEGDRTTASLSREGDTVTVDVVASDLTALRAGQNTWVTLLEVAERAGDT